MRSLMAHTRFMTLAMISTLAVWNISPAAAGTTRTYVVSWFHVAVRGVSEACPNGPNILSDEFYKRELLRLGNSPEHVEHLLSDFPNGPYIPLVVNRGRLNGEPTNAYAFPLTVPNPHIKLVGGKYAYGFNLDSKESISDFVEPVTKERGIDNQFFRAVGCFQSHTGELPQRPGYPMTLWDLTRDYQPAWLVEISGIDDENRDDDVDVNIYRAIRPVLRDASGEVRADTTFQVDPDRRMQNSMQGSILNGVLTTKATDIRLLSDPLLQPEFLFNNARLRLKLSQEGFEGVLGGYHSWQSLYWGAYGSHGWPSEHASGVDFVGLYHALKDLADAEPDPSTGENKSISATFWIEGVPAFIDKGGLKALSANFGP